VNTKLTLHVDENLIKQIKIAAVLENTTVSAITEELYREFLKRRKGQR